MLCLLLLDNFQSKGLEEWDTLSFGYMGTIAFPEAVGNLRAVKTLAGSIGELENLE